MQAIHAALKKVPIYAAASAKPLKATPELALVFQRVYTLRNQLMYGGATWHGKTNRAHAGLSNVNGTHRACGRRHHVGPSGSGMGEACYPVID